MAVNVQSLAIEDIKQIRPPKFDDDRGFVSATNNKRALAAAGIASEFAQDNHAYSAAAYTLREFHVQAPPHAQNELVRVVRGAIRDVTVDIRPDSPTYGRHVTAVISATDWNQIRVPIGVAHGLLTLAPDTEVLYKVSHDSAPEHARGVF